MIVEHFVPLQQLIKSTICAELCPNGLYYGHIMGVGGGKEETVEGKVCGAHL